MSPISFKSPATETKGETLASGHTVEFLSAKQNEEYGKLFLANKNDPMIRLNPGGLFVPIAYRKYADRYYNFQFKPTDILLVTFPKSGSTWTQEILWSMVYNKNLDNADAANGINLRVPFMEVDMLTPPTEVGAVSEKNDITNHFNKICSNRRSEDGVFIQMAEMTPDPRIIKTHLPLSVLNPKLMDTCKIVFVVREPKDCCISYRHHMRLSNLNEFVGSVDDFVKLFVADDLYNSPYWGMIKEAWQLRNHHNMLFLYYEDMKADIMKEISKIDAFLGTNLSETQLRNIIKYTSFEEMKKRNNLITSNDDNNPSFKSDVVKQDGGFFRKGIVGDSKNVLNQEQIKILNDWTAENTKDMPGFKYAPAEN